MGFTDDQLETEDDEFVENDEPGKLEDCESESEFHPDCPKEVVLDTSVKVLNVSGNVDVPVEVLSLPAPCPWLQGETLLFSALPLVWLQLHAWPVPVSVLVSVFQLEL